jgi:hypothetical protein
MLRVLLGVACAAGAAGSAGCYTHQCDAQTTHYDGGELIDTGNGTYLYVTNPLQSSTQPWVDFPGQVTLVVTYPKSISDTLASCSFIGMPEAAIGTSSAPNDDDGAVFTPNAGQTAQFTEVSTRGFSVTNGSCAGYSTRIAIPYASCRPPSGSDAGSD